MWTIINFSRVIYEFFTTITSAGFIALLFKRYPFWRIDKPRNIQIIQNGGWHFAYLQTPENISRKIKSFAHGEYHKEHLVDEKNIQSKIEKGEDVFERGYKIKKIELDSSFPQFILDNRENLKNWIL